MTTEKQPQGNFVGFHNRAKKKGDRLPAFTGKVQIPGTDREFRLALWAKTDKNGEVMFSGLSSDFSGSDTALEQIDALAGADSDARTLEQGGMKLRPGQVMLFKNGFKDEANPDRPDFYGRWNPGTGEDLVSISAWARKTRTQQPILTGQTQYPLPGKNPAMDTEASRLHVGNVQVGYDQEADER